LAMQALKLTDVIFIMQAAPQHSFTGFCCINPIA